MSISELLRQSDVIGDQAHLNRQAKETHLHQAELPLSVDLFRWHGRV